MYQKYVSYYTTSIKYYHFILFFTLSFHFTFTSTYHRSYRILTLRWFSHSILTFTDEEDLLLLRFSVGRSIKNFFLVGILVDFYFLKEIHQILKYGPPKRRKNEGICCFFFFFFPRKYSTSQLFWLFLLEENILNASSEFWFNLDIKQQLFFLYNVRQ